MKNRSEAEKKYIEYELLKFSEQRKEFMKNPQLINLMWETTTRCNARCDHCAISCDNHQQVEEIDIKYVKKALYDLAEKYDPSTIFFVATGGEPLLRKGLFEVMEYATSLGYQWGMSTNGSLLTKTMVKKLIDHKIESVNISIDGLKERHEAFRKLPGYWDKIWDGIRMLQEQGKGVVNIIQISTCANKKNLGELDDIYKFLVDHNIQYWRILGIQGEGRAAENSDILLDKDDYDYIFDFIERKRAEHKIEQIVYGCSDYLGLNLENRVRNGYFICMPGTLVASILSNGDIFVCPNIPKRPELIQGNIKVDNFADVWANRFQFFRDEHRQASPECLACAHWKFCGGGALHSWDFDKHEQTWCMKDKISNFE